MNVHSCLATYELEYEMSLFIPYEWCLYTLLLYTHKVCQTTIYTTATILF